MNRRSFIQKSGLLTTALFVSLKSYPAALFILDNKVNGKITSKGKGVANVVVSDGFSVIQTDRNGNYEIALNALSEFIWISTPSGYAFETESYIAKQYGKLDGKGNLNFDLKSLKQQDNQHSFIIWADPQVKNMQDVAEMMATSVPDVKELVKSLDKDTLLHGIGVGDLVWDNHALFPSYNEAVAKMGIPFFQALGNHDQDYLLGGDETADKTFKQYYGPTYYSFNRGKAHYVVMDDVRYLGVERKYDGYISQQQLDWLEKDLKFVPKDALLIICVHIPIHNSVKNNADFYKIVADFKQVHVMSGHTHYNRNVITKNVYEHNHGTVCGAWWTGPVCEDGTPRGYGVYAVDGTKLKWYYKSTGEAKNKQVSIYLDKLTNQHRLLANVWNYDPEWKVEYYLDGKLMGEMENQKAYDPQTVALYKGDKLPAKRAFAEPKLNDHMFLAHFTADVREVKVVATDRFGDKFEASLPFDKN